MKPRTTTTSDVTTPPGQSQLEVSWLAKTDDIQRLKLEFLNLRHKKVQCDARRARLKLEFQASSLHAFILVGIRDLDNVTPPQDLATATAQKFPQGLLQPDQGIKQGY